jgi:hypothetical protein
MSCCRACILSQQLPLQMHRFRENIVLEICLYGSLKAMVLKYSLREIDTQFLPVTNKFYMFSLRGQSFMTYVGTAGRPLHY